MSICWMKWKNITCNIVSDCIKWTLDIVSTETYYVSTKSCGVADLNKSVYDCITSSFADLMTFGLYYMKVCWFK